jgi:predicted phage-related endonuclease
MPATREEWLSLRAPYVGASEVAALLGFQADFQMSPLALYLVKRREISAPEVGGERIEWGHDFEDAICKRACREEGWILRPGVFAVDDTIEGSSASLDRVVHPSPADEAAGFIGPGALEAKNVDWKQRLDKWLGDEPPPHILIQLQDQLACSGYLWGAVTACFGGNEYFVQRYLRHEGIIAAIRDAKTRFWRQVRDGVPPPADGYESTAKALRAKYPATFDATIDLSGSNELPGLCVELQRASKDRKALEEREAEIKNLFRQMMGTARYAIVAGGIRISHSIGADTPPRPANAGEIINGRKGQDRVTVTIPKAA